MGWVLLSLPACPAPGACPAPVPSFPHLSVLQQLSVLGLFFMLEALKGFMSDSN